MKKMKLYRQPFTVRNAGLLWNILSNGGGEPKKALFLRAAMSGIEPYLPKRATIASGWTINCAAKTRDAGRPLKSALFKQWFSIDWDETKTLPGNNDSKLFDITRRGKRIRLKNCGAAVNKESAGFQAGQQMSMRQEYQQTYREHQ
jgi:hypothetical protein